MKVPLSIRSTYEQHEKECRGLQEHVDRQIEAIRDPSWHYVGRIKTLESFAQKLETGRFTKEQALEDIFACTLVVERADRINEAERRLNERFDIRVRKPDKPGKTFHRPMCFDFDYVRLYACLRRDERQPATGYEEVVFEIQIKTFLQHAWTIATHDLIYKTDSVDWEASRVAYQVKAMLEHAEASITAVKAIAESNQPARSDNETSELKAIIDWLRATWAQGLPHDTVRLAECVRSFIAVIDIDLPFLANLVSVATSAGKGALTLNLSPFCSIVEAVLMSSDGIIALESAATSKRRFKQKIVVPSEIELPKQSAAVEKLLYRTQ
jgi:ppGpp synthetase/RelA/SpoT-type nucleotidyltranferase